MNRLTAAIAAHLTARLAALRENPDAGMETADKILWAAAMVIVASGAGLLFKTKIDSFINGLTISLGW
ncbi:MAG: hypothetical protein QOJ50_1811 [Cryptosporangiaceae bacterium]|jgi:hypothetical protein|nr:hypothetical protein [Cryptosporangiaceae bacterium]